MQTLTHRGRTVIRPSRELAKVIPCCPTCGAPVIWSGSPGREIVECIDLYCNFQAIRKPEHRPQLEIEPSLLDNRFVLIGLSPLLMVSLVLFLVVAFPLVTLQILISFAELIHKVCEES